MTPPLAVTLAALGQCTDIYKSVHPPRKIGWNQQMGPPRGRGKTWEAWKLVEHLPLEELPIPPQNATEHVKAAFALDKAIRQMAFQHALVLAYAD